MNSKQYTKEDKKQIMKMIYNYLCLEVLYERKRKSILLANITLLKNLEELKEYITQELKNELKEIKTSTYGNLELIKYLDMLINLKGTILDEEVIRTIMKCNKPELVQRINQELISKNKKQIESQQKDVRNINYDLSIDYKAYKQTSWEKTLNEIFLTAHIILFCGSTTLSLFTANEIQKFVAKGGPKEYKTKIESISSLGEETHIEDYISQSFPTKTLEKYSKTYIEEGKQYKKLEIYDISNFETTEEIEKYFTIDVEFLGLKPIETKTIDAKDLEKDEYQVFRNATKNLEDYKMSRTPEDEGTRLFLKIVLYILLLVSVTRIPGMPIQEIIKIIDKIIAQEAINNTIKEKEDKLKEIIKQLEELLNSNNIKLNEINEYFEEMRLMSNDKKLTPEEQEILDTYNSLKSVEESESKLKVYKYYRKLKRKLV